MDLRYAATAEPGRELDEITHMLDAYIKTIAGPLRRLGGSMGRLLATFF